MKKTLLATTALAFAGATAAAPASAADMLNVGVGGYMQQWFGYADRDDKNSDGGVDTQADTEIFFQGSLESDMGLKYTVHVELEGNQMAGGSSTLDESFVRVTGEFGDLEFGSRDHSMVRMHSAISDVGIGLSAGDTQKWIPGAYLDTAGHGSVAGGGDALKLSYISPRVSGLQLGVSYAPDSDNKDDPTTPPNGNDEASWGAGLNFQQGVGDASVTFSLGHRSRSTAETELRYPTGTWLDRTENDDVRLMLNREKELKKTIKVVTDREKESKSPDAAQTAAALDAQARIDDSTDGMMMRGDNSTLTNAGMGVTFGAFGFNVAYATSDGGAYKTTVANVGLTQADVTALNATVEGGNPYTLGEDGKVIDSRHMYDPDGDDGPKQAAAETAANNDPDNDSWAAKKVVEDKSKNFDVWGVSVSYTDGPVALSLGHMVHEEDEGGEREATMLSASYTLAPGVAWRSSIFTAEDTTSHKDVTGGVNEGTGFVTGITLNF